MTKLEMLKMIKELKVKFIRLQFTDILGRIKNLAITIKEFEDDLKTGVLFDGSAIDGFARIKEDEMYLKPDYDTFRLLPWRSKDGGRVARLICDIYTIDGAPFTGGPRNVLKSTIAKAESLGCSLLVAAELEFFLLRNFGPGKELITCDNSSYFDLEDSGVGRKVREEIVSVLEQMGLEVESSHHEVAPGQHEIVISSQKVLKAVDDIVTAKFVVKSIAKKHNLQATFMPKPMYGKNGSGLHLQQMLFKKGSNLFYAQNDSSGVSRTAKCYMAGILNHAQAITAITNPTINSYKRLVSGYEAPVSVDWSTADRNSLFKISGFAKEDKSLEIRNVDAIANPYLALAVILGTGLKGIENKIEILSTKTLPTDLNLALRALKEDRFVQKLLGDYITNKFITAKEIEWGVYRTQVHDWELDNYLDLFRQNRILQRI